MTDIPPISFSLRVGWHFHCAAARRDRSPLLTPPGLCSTGYQSECFGHRAADYRDRECGLSRLTN